MVLITGIFQGVPSGRAEEVLDFTVDKPPLVEVGKKYRLVLHPGKDARPVSLIFMASGEVFGEDEGKKWTNVETLIQEGHGELPIESQGGVQHVDVVDYDNDGYLDFRTIAGWGTGGSWYNYYRYDGKKYVVWEEPMELGINHIEPEKAFASSHGRSGPCWSAAYYNITGGHFVLYETELFNQAVHRRELVPKEVPDNHYVLITETIEKNRIVYRKIEVSNPWEDERDAKTVFAQKVNEKMKKSESQ